MNPIPFIRESFQEVKKATWLPRQQAIGSTIVIIVLIIVIALYSSAIDWVLAVVLGALLGAPV